ncbi:hypothetical protein [Enterococcus alishanensis]
MGGKGQSLILPINEKRKITLIFSGKNYLKSIWLKAEKYKELVLEGELNATRLLDTERVVLENNGRFILVKIKSGRRIYDEKTVEDSIHRVGYYSMTVIPEMKIHRDHIEAYLNQNYKKK